MRNYPILKCQCCEDKYSEIDVKPTSLRQLSLAKFKLNLAIKAIQGRGKLQIVKMDGLIIGAIYDYADAEEVARRAEFFSAIEKVFEDISSVVQETCKPVLIDVI
jgi:hypothetical protein